MLQFVVPPRVGLVRIGLVDGHPRTRRCSPPYGLLDVKAEGLDTPGYGIRSHEQDGFLLLDWVPYNCGPQSLVLDYCDGDTWLVKSGSFRSIS